MSGWYLSFSLSIWTPILSFSLLCCLLLFAAFCFTIHQLYCNKNNGRPISIHNSKCIKTQCWITIILFLGAQIFNDLYVIYTKLPIGIHNKYTETLWSCYNILWSFAYSCIYWLFFQTLRELKKQYGKLKISPIQEWLFIILVVMVLLIQLFISLLSILLSWRQWSWSTFNIVYLPALISEISTELILNAFIVFLYVSKIKEMSLEMQNNEIDGINRAKKYFKLTLFTVISTSIFTVSEIVLSESINYATKTKSFQFYEIAYIVYFILGNIDSMVSTIYVLLVFSIAKHWNKSCCFCQSKCFAKSDKEEDLSQTAKSVTKSVQIVNFLCGTRESSNSSGTRRTGTKPDSSGTSVNVKKYCHKECSKEHGIISEEN